MLMSLWTSRLEPLFWNPKPYRVSDFGNRVLVLYCYQDLSISMAGHEKRANRRVYFSNLGFFPEIEGPNANAYMY